MGRGTDWQAIAQPFSERYLCLLPDLPGHGDNLAWPFETPLSLSSVAADLMARTFDKLTLLGYSMGGRVALQTAINYPTRVSRLVVESGNPGIVEASARQARALLDEQRATEIRKLGIETFVERWYDLPLFASLHRQPSLLAQIKTARRQNEARWAAKVISELSPGRQPELWSRLGEIRVPTLLITGDLDSKYLEITNRMAAKIPQAQIAIIPQAGHIPHAEQPQRFIKQIEQFLSG